MLACGERRPAVHQGCRQFGQAVRAEQRRSAAERLLRRGRARAQASIPTLLSVGAQRLAGNGACALRAPAAARGRALPAVHRRKPARGRVLSAPVRIGVVGAGALGYHHVRLLRAVDGATLVGFYDSRPDRAQQVATELDVRAFDSVESLVDACDALTIAVPTPAHHAVATV